MTTTDPQRLDPAAIPARLAPTGLQIEAAFSLPHGWLLAFATADSPFEEVLHILLADPAGQVRATRRLGGAYTPGILSDVRALAADRFAFRFPATTPWHLAVRPPQTGWRGWLGRPLLRLTRA
ncbi:MAG: hypothetical protein KGJ41_18555 [Rhodospirillales bacterium]|nr:hypothetical protein [Rhodospirillales bacterium]MDE2201011.1 hypothetical protein [Rhodospirillales bacterium]MDE2574993.1 hypothetical protein [Rhodospirillales bacterium]